MGTWQLGLEYLGYGGNGEYGEDSVLVTHSLVTDSALSMPSVLVAAINTTDYFNGLFGLGITQGRFNGKVAESPLTQAVQKSGWIPSYSYAYTAGAHYRKSFAPIPSRVACSYVAGDSPVSLTLGGYQQARFEDHGIEFNLDSRDGLPHSLVRAIEVNITDGENKPKHWNSSTEILSTFNNSFDALIDSTTPYLWLPEEICDRFAQTLNLTYNSTFELYTITDEQYRDFMKEDSFSFTFSLSSYDNTNYYDEPLDTYGVINITIPARAFTSTLQYPFMNEAIEYGDPAVPYFSLRRATNTSTLIIGRSFLQEAYIVTKYDEGAFSLYQALFPDISESNINFTTIYQPDNAAYPGPGYYEDEGLSKAEQAGIAVGVIVGCSILGTIGWLCYRRRQKKRHGHPDTSSEKAKDLASLSTQDSPVSRILSLLGRRWKSPKTGAVYEKDVEHVSEAPNTQIYELPAPIPPAELDADDRYSLNGDTLGTDSTQNMTAYEVARRKMDRQLQGPVPAYSPPSDGVLVPAEKAEQIITTTQITPPRVRTHPPSPPVSPSAETGTAVSNTMNISLPSPITPRLDWTPRIGEPPSPLTSTNVGSSTQQSGPLLRPESSESDTDNSVTSSHLGSDNAKFVGTSNLPLSMGQATVQRTPIEPSRVVYLGPLPGNVRLSQHGSESQLLDANDEADIADEDVHRGHNTYDSLGSNFTVDEEMRIEMTRQGNSSSHGTSGLRQVQTNGASIQQSSSARGNEPTSPDNHGRIDPGFDLVHVPQLAERRYSWEEER